MTEVSLQEFKDVVERVWQARLAYEESLKVTNEASKVLEDLKAKVLAYMEHYAIEKQHVPGYGTLSTQRRFSARVPQGDEKLEFFSYLKERNLFEALATVNSNTLNSWLQEEQDKALSEGNVDWRCPGIGEMKIVKTLSFRKG